MPEKVEYLKAESMIRVHSYDDVTIADIEESLSSVVALIEETGVRRLLVDTRDQKSVPGVLDLYDFVKEFPSDISVAIALSNKTFQDQEFVELVGTNRGKKIKVFHRVEDAIEWLKQRA